MSLSRKRLVSVCLMALLLSGAALTTQAAAVEGPGDEAPHERPSIEEVGTQSETARGFFPDPYEEPSVFPFLIMPLLIGAVVILFVVLVLYLVWHPGFAEHRRTKSRR